MAFASSVEKVLPGELEFHPLTDMRRADFEKLFGVRGGETHRLVLRGAAGSLPATGALPHAETPGRSPRLVGGLLFHRQTGSLAGPHRKAFKSSY